VADPPGFSLLDFGVAEASRPSNAFVCRVEPLGQQAFWSEWDVSIPGAITCTPVELPEWELIPLKLAKELLHVFKWLR
jgi:hypothetical protein